jgi:hypothetical protein
MMDARTVVEDACTSQDTSLRWFAKGHAGADPAAYEAQKGGTETGDWSLSRRAKYEIHAIADAKGRLLSILLSGGEAHDCAPAQRLIRRCRPVKKLLGDKAYDSAELRE